MLLVLCACVLPGCGTTNRVSAPPRPHLFVDAQGKCPLRPTVASGPECRLTRAGNGVAGLFHLPKRAWGIAYAYNCGPQASDFYVLVGLPVLDGQMPETGFNRHGRAGRGFYMETGRGWQTWHSLPPEWRGWENLEIASTCAWHVRAVLGTARQVARYVPPIPGA